MDSTTVLEEDKAEHVCSPRQIQSLYEVCRQLKDGRKARGRQYDLAGILLVVVLAKLAGMSNLLAVSEWAKDQEQVIRANVKLSWKRMPCTKWSFSAARCSRGDDGPLLLGVDGMKQDSLGLPLAQREKPLAETGRRLSSSC